MALTDKYASLMSQVQALGVKNLQVKEANGKLVVSGTTEYQMEKDLLWDAIKKVPGWDQEVQADIKAERSDVWGVWEVKPGESLSKIAKSAYDNAGEYMRIFEANKNILTDPNVIHPGQKLVIPKK
jgi:nucleoid-associated protein YgaU